MSAISSSSSKSSAPSRSPKETPRASSRADSGSGASRSSSSTSAATESARSTSEPTDRASIKRETEEPARSETLDSLTSGIADWATTTPDKEGATKERDASAAETDELGSEVEAAKLELEDGELLRRGAEGEKVTRIQDMLKADGFDLAVDGKFGPETQETIREFQRRNNLKVDGVVGPETQRALNGVQVEPGQSTPAEELESGEDTPSTPVEGRGSLEGLPARAEDALTGSEFMDSIRNLPPGPQRDQAILNEVLSGNIPDNLRNMQEVVLQQGGREIRLQATPDYLAVGSNDDNIRVPMTPEVAQAIADRTGTSLPTNKIVDAIHAQSQKLHLAPFGDAPGAQDIGHFISHDQRIDDQLGSGVAPETFVSGHKKDIVIPARDGRVAIYGGSWANGNRVQPYSNVHGDYYADYSHGARLVSQQITVDGQSMNLQDALADPSLAGLLTDYTAGAFRY